MALLRLFVIVSGLLLTGCSGILNQHRFEPVTENVAFKDPPPSRIVTGSIYQSSQAMRLFEDRTARQVGDILTVRLTERTSASKDASTSFGKESSTTITNPTLFGKAVTFGDRSLETSVSGNRSFDGTGESDQSNTLSGTVTAVVIKVYPNGNLLIQGEKKLALNQGEEFIKITGVIRPDDIAPDNSISSTQVADAEITYAGKGALADANAAGWLARFFVSALWPF